MKVSVFRKAHFNAAHRLFVPEWDDEKNSAVFGLCSNPKFHGHNYNLAVKVTGEVDEQTGFVIDLKVLKDIIKTNVLLPFDHKNLNLEVDDFKNTNPTAENIAIAIYNRIKPHLKADLELQIRLYETERNFVEFPA